MEKHIRREPQVSRRTLLGSATGAVVAGLATHHGIVAQEATPAGGSGTGFDTDALDAFIGEALERYGVPGAAVAVVQGGQPLLAKGYGVREFGNDAPVDGNTVFQLASNTKAMTAFTAATLVDDGLIGWDTPIIEVLPELVLMDSYANQHVSLRDVLAHRSGLPAFGGDLLAHLGYDRAEMLRRLRFVEPGSSFREVAGYSNLGFFIAGEVIGRLTGGPWEAAMHERLMQPLGMLRSGPASDVDWPEDGNASAAHARIDGDVVTVEREEPGTYGAAGSAVSTANDLVPWLQVLLDDGAREGQQVVQPETVQEMFAPSMVSPVTFTETPPITEDSGFAYGLGWGVFNSNGYRIVEKGGALAGVRTVVDLVPELGFGIAVVANLNLTFLPEAIRAFALEQLTGPAVADAQGTIEAQEAMLFQLLAPEPAPENPEPASVPLDNFAGSYENAMYGTFDVVLDGDALRIEAGPARKEATLSHVGHATFLLDWGSVTSLPEQTTFIIGPDGTATAFEAETLGRFDRVTG